jgi:hypothetical protein
MCPREREHPSLLLQFFFYLGDFGKTRLKADTISLCRTTGTHCRFIFYLSIGVQYFVKLGAKIQIIFQIKRIWGESIYIFKKK